jgi:hypothetical protein
MKYALVHKNEPVLDGFKICEIADNTFEVHANLSWHEVADDVTANTHYWKDDAPVLFPVAEPKTQPATSGTQTL